MRTRRRLALASLGFAMVVSGCKVFENPTPHDIIVRLTGNAEVEIIMSRQFVAGVDEDGGTHLQVFSPDTLHRTLPLDTVINIEVDRRFFIQVTPWDVDQISLGARVDVDDRNVLNDSGDVFASDPWRYVYLFNQQITRIVDVEF